MLLLVLSAAALLFAAHRLSVLCGLTGALERAVAVTLGWFGLVLLDAFVLGGALRALRPGPLCVSSLLLAVVVGVAARRHRVTDGGRVGMPTVARAVLPGLLRSPASALLVLIVAAQLAYRVLVAARLPIMDWDGLWYHLTMVDRWVQDGAITRVREVIWSDTYPANTELMTAWVATFLHSTRLAGFTQLAALPMAAGAVAMLARQAGASPRFGAVAGLAFLATPLVYVQSTTMFIDVSFTAALLAAWAFGTAAVLGLRDGSPATRARSAYAGVAAGLALGSKGTGPIAIGLLGVVLGVLVLTHAWRAAPPAGRARAMTRQLTAPVLLFGVPLLVLGTPWYVRNLLLFHNPVYPFVVGPFPGLPEASVVLSTPPELRGLGPLTQLWHSWRADLHPGPQGYWYAQNLGGFGAQWLLVLLPCLVVLSVVLVRRRQRALLVALVVPALLMLALQPHAWWSRFTLFLPALGAVALGAVAARARRLPAALLVLAFVAASGASMVVATAHANWPIGPGDDPFVSARQVGGLLKSSADKRAETGFWGSFTDMRALPRGTVVGVPWDLQGTRPACCVMMHPIVGNDLSVTLRTLPETDGLPALLTALHREHAQDVLVLKGSPTEALLGARPDMAVPVGNAGWLARVFALTPAAAQAPAA